MLTQAENDVLTRVGAGTPMGDLLRRYWQPLGAASEMKAAWTKRVRLFRPSSFVIRHSSFVIRHSDFVPNGLDLSNSPLLSL